MQKLKHFFRSGLCLLLVAALLLPLLPAQGIAAAADGDDFTPILRFAVTSDVHIRDASSALNGYEMLAKFYDTVYDYSEAQTDYNKLDGIFIIGDLAQDGTVDQLTYFFDYSKAHTKEDTLLMTLLGNHEFYDTGRDWDGDAAPNRFMEIGGYDATDHHIELSGYHFILLSMDRYDTVNNVFFSDAKLAWLEDEIEKAIADDPNKPIFVMQHESPYGTMKGSSGTSSDKNLTPLLANYPQVVNFSGHTHVSLSDPRVIWQDTFTALNTGSLAYLCMPIMDGTHNETGGMANDMEGGWTPESISQGTRNGGMYYIVEVDAQHRTRILTYNIFSESLWGEPYLIESYDPADFVYTADRANNAVKPEFPANAAVRVVSDNYRNVKIAFTQATCKDVVQSYRVELYQGDTLLTTTYRSSMANYGEAAPSEITAYFPNLEPNTAYTVKVYAGSSYDLHSDPISMQFTTAPETGKLVADVLDVVFREDGSAVNKADGTVLETFGTPTVEYDADAGTYTASFDGVDDAYSFHGLGNWFDTIGESFTIETYAYMPDKPSGSMGILASLSSSGLGMRYLTSGAVQLYCHVGGSYKKVLTGSLKNRWVHLTGTYDGTTLKMYVNGVAIGELIAEGTMTQPEAAYYTRSMFIGADCQLNGARYYFDGKIATARVYSQVLSDTDVAELYNITTGTSADNSCQEHTAISDWTAVSDDDWSAGGSISSGHYKLTENVNLSAALTVAADAEVCIDLAGYNITASAEAAEGKWYRVFENEGKLTIMDSAFSDGTISGGIAWAGDTDTYAKGGNIYNGASAVFNLYDGIIYGGIVTTADVDAPGSIGGNIYGTEGSEINIKGGAVTGGVATKGSGNTKENYIYGGNIYSTGTVNISGGTISNGYSYYRGGNLAVLGGGTTNLSGSAVIKGGTISDHSDACRGDNIVVSGKNSTLNVYDNAQIIDPNSDYDIYAITNAIVAVYGGRIAGGVHIHGTDNNKDAKFSMYGGYVNTLRVAQVIPTTNINLYNGVLGQEPTTGWLAQCACFVNNGDGTYSIWHDGASDGTCAVCGYDYTGITLQTGKHNFAMTGDSTAACHCGSTKTGVFLAIDGFACTTLDEAQSFLSSGDTIVLAGNILKDSTVTKDLILDLNGFDVDADITVASGVSCYIKDSQTDDYTVADDNYGRITGIITGASPLEGYVQITETDGTSFHKVDLSLKSVSLRANSVGIYYTAKYLYDEVVARNLTASGVTLSTENPNPVADDSDESSLYTTSGNSVLLSNIMKTDNSVNANNTKARQPVYGRAYLKLDDSYVYSSTVSTNLREVVETIDEKLWDSLTDDQKASLAQMYSAYSDVMDSWQIDNLKNYQA
ncbi:MAG: metallophosphoesterase [Oscillospiraceae bacterium]|nr:metallophosphoesterase [Oscillospiraceae bacterium]